MMVFLRLGLLVAMFLGVTSCQSGASERVPGPQRVDGLLVAEGLEATLWAESPLLYNPTNIDVDEEGRVWVIEAVDYRNFNNPPETHLTHPQGERIVILEDTDSDGMADTAKVFVQDEELIAPLGLAVTGNQVVVSASPSIFVYTDTDGDDKADERGVFLTGFGSKNHDHGLHAVTVGPGGRWYFNVGNAGPHVVTDRTGWTLRVGSIYNGGTPYMGDNQPGLMSDGGHVWTGGLALRVQPDGTGLEVLAHNFRNPYELAVDSYGNLWTNDNDGGGASTCRVLWVMEGANTGYFSADGSRNWDADRRPGQSNFTAQWHQEDPGVIPAGYHTGAGAPTGIVVNESDLLGEQYQGVIVSANAGRNVIFGYHPVPEGAGYRLEQFVFASTVSDTALRASRMGYEWNEVKQNTRKWFRPSDVAVGPGGAVYIADWYDPIVGGHAMRDHEGYGRIYRITPEGRDLRVPDYDLNTTEGQIQALLSPAKNVRALGFVRLESKGVAVIDEVKEVLSSDNPYHRARAVWLLAQLGPEGVREVEELLDNPDSDIRITAFRALRQVRGQEAMLAYAQRLAKDPSPAVRRAVAVALREVPLEKDREIILELAQRYGGDDRWMLEAVGLAVKGDETAVYELLKGTLGGPDPAEWSEVWADLVWRLHPAPAAEALKARAEAAGLSREARERALIALGFIIDTRAMEAMKALAKSERTEVAERAQWWLDYRKANEWRPFMAAGESSDDVADAERRMIRLREALLNTAKPVSQRIEAALKMAETPIGGRMLVGLVSEGKLPPEAGTAVQEELLKNPDQTVRVLTHAYFQLPEAALSLERITQLDPDAERGRTRFYASCVVCHRAGEVGGRIGPDLTQIHEKYDKAGLAKAILHPSSVIMHGFEPVQITKNDGTVIVGFLQADGETVVVMDDRRREHILAAEHIAARKRLNISLMPGPAVLGLSEQDVADLTEFLMAVEEP